MSGPRVAVVIPCFNYGHFIGETLDSVAQQEPCELVVIDDGSDDPATLEVLDGLRRRGIRVISHENRGLSEARMTGVRATTAPYVHVLDADDLLPEGTLTALADVLDANPQIAASWGDYQTFGTESCHFPRARSLDPWRITYLAEITGTALVRRDAIERTGGWSMGSGYEDWDFWMGLAEHGFRGVHVDRITLLYRQHAASMLARMRQDHTATFERIRARHPDLFAARRANRRRSSAPRLMKLLFGPVSRMPLLDEQRRYQIYTLVRHYAEPQMSSDCYLTPSQRLRRRLRPEAR